MAVCAKCGATVAAGAAFCGSCGEPAAASTAAPAAGTSSGAGAATGLTPNVAAMLAYILGFISGIIFLVIEPYNRDKFVRFHAFQSIFFNAGLLAFWIAWSILTAVLGVVTFGVLGVIMGLLGLVIALAVLVFYIFLMVKAYKNERYMIPWIGNLAAQQADRTA